MSESSADINGASQRQPDRAASPESGKGADAHIAERSERSQLGPLTAAAELVNKATDAGKGIAKETVAAISEKAVAAKTAVEGKTEEVKAKVEATANTARAAITEKADEAKAAARTAEAKVESKVSSAKTAVEGEAKAAKAAIADKVDTAKHASHKLDEKISASPELSRDLKIAQGVAEAASHVAKIVVPGAGMAAQASSVAKDVVTGQVDAKAAGHAAGQVADAIAPGHAVAVGVSDIAVKAVEGQLDVKKELAGVANPTFPVGDAAAGEFLDQKAVGASNQDAAIAAMEKGVAAAPFAAAEQHFDKAVSDFGKEDYQAAAKDGGKGVDEFTNEAAKIIAIVDLGVAAGGAGLVRPEPAKTENPNMEAPKTEAPKTDSPKAPDPQKVADPQNPGESPETAADGARKQEIKNEFDEAGQKASPDAKDADVLKQPGVHEIPERPGDDDSVGSPLDDPVYQQQIEKAQAAYQGIPDRTTGLSSREAGKATARTESGVTWSESGYTDRPNFSGAPENTERVIVEGGLAGRAPDEHPFDEANRQAPGTVNASHAEKQVAVMAPDEPIGVNRDMCPDCRGWFEQWAIDRETPQFVADPRGTHVFMPDGSYHFAPH